MAALIRGQEDSLLSAIISRVTDVHGTGDLLISCQVGIGNSKRSERLHMAATMVLPFACPVRPAGCQGGATLSDPEACLMPTVQRTLSREELRSLTEAISDLRAGRRIQGTARALGSPRLL